MTRTRCVSRTVRAFCMSSKVFSSMLAPARSRNEAAICVMAKRRSRRLVPPVMRTLPVARPKPCEEFDEGRRGTKARSTAANIASPAPTHSMLESTVRSIARIEKRETNAQQRPGAAEQQAFRKKSAAQSSVSGAERGAYRKLSFTPNGTRQDQIGDVRNSDDENECRGREQNQQNGACTRCDLFAQHRSVDLRIRLFG